jgi:uncharacterized protein (TIGR02145 family)
MELNGHWMIKITAIVFALFCVACEQQKDTFTDTRNGKVYKTVKIGEQVWLAQNLNYDVNGSKCYENELANCDKYGRLYNWEMAMKSCPSGWHLPSKAEWEALTEAVLDDFGPVRKKCIFS